MPPVTKTNAKSETTPDKLRPYEFHGVDFNSKSSREWVADCPFCGRDNKFSVNVTSGQWQCFVCREGSEKGGGNVATFLRRLIDLAMDFTTTEQYQSLATDRGLLSVDTLVQWGAAVSPLSRSWLLCGYSWSKEKERLRLNQLYKYSNRLYLTPGLGHSIHGVYQSQAYTIYLCEGPWDGMALYELLSQTKATQDGYERTASSQSSLLQDACVLAVPGCGSVGEPLKRFLPLFRGKRVVLMFDNDHPRKHPTTGKLIEPAGLEATKRAASIISGVAETVEFLRWGPNYWTEDHPSGYDLRDYLNGR